MQLPVSARFLTALVAIASFLSPQQPDEEVRVRPDLDALIASWRAVHGESWRAFEDWETGHLQMLAGGTAEAPFTPATGADEDWAELALAYIGLAEPMFGVERESLRFDFARLLPFGQYGSTDKMTVRFVQELDGVPVVGGSTNVLMDMSGRLLSIQSIASPRLVGLGTTPTITSGFAATTAAAEFEARVRLAPTSVGAPTLVIHQHRDAGLRAAVLAWQVDVAAEVLDAQPEVLRFWLDAGSAAVLEVEDQVMNFDVGGTVQTLATPGVFPDEPSNPEQALPTPRLRVTSSAGTVFTDDNGDFNYPGVNGPLSCTFEYVGTFVDVFNIAGSDYSFNQSLSGTGNVVTMNPSPSELTTAQANAFVHVNGLRDWIRSVIPGDTTADFQVDSNCNRNSNCNAYFDGSSINFYTSGGGCVNTAYSTVVVHEEGHWLNVLYGTGNGSSGIGEGNADVFATYLYDAPVMGENFCGPGCFVRDGNNTRQFCGDCCVGCHGGVHNNGEVWMGATWKVRTNLKNTHGAALGGDIANLIFLGWMNAYDQNTITSIMETQWLTLDDDDGNIGNGTPNFGDIDAGYRQQGFPGVDLDDVIITDVTLLPDSADEAGPYQVDATIVAQVNPPLQSSNLRWRSNGGSYNTVPLNGTGGNDFTAYIPDVPSPAIIEYYIEATDNNGVTETFPTGAPADVLDFKVGVLTVFFSNDFEGGTNEGWAGGAAGDDATTGVWERGDPRGTAAQPENDHTSPPGTLCWFTGQGSAGGSVGENDVDGGTTTLLSPVFDAAGLTNAEVSYWRWYSNDQGGAPNADVFVVEVSNNGGSSWTNVETVGPTGPETSGGWIQHAFRIADFVTPTSTMRLRFQASDLGSGSIVEAAIDDVEGTDLGPSGGGPDCNDNGVPDGQDISNGTSLDCNSNGVPDECDIASGISLDCNANGTPDECETDCNANGVPDECDLASGTSADCNANSVPDECDIASGTSLDCNANGSPDECETDCNANGVPDDCDIAGGTSSDCNANSIPDECDVSSGTSLDCNSNGTPDECETDCNANGVPDDCDLASGTSADCNANSIPDECDIAAGTSLDCNSNGTPDECETDCNANGVPDDCDLASGTSADCNANSIPDECDLAAGTSLDCNSNGTPDECETDCNANGVPDDCDLASGTSADCNANSVPDECDIASGTSADANGNGTPDECECLGTTYCVTAPNSAGSGALISYSGTTGIAANDLVLEAQSAPAGQFGIFYYGPNQTQVPFGDGFRCVGGGVFRLPVAQTDGLGNAAIAVDYANLPTGGDVAAGENWNFQFWYRDPGGPGGTGFNLTDGLSLTFCD